MKIPAWLRICNIFRVLSRIIYNDRDFSDYKHNLLFLLGEGKKAKQNKKIGSLVITL